MKTHRLLGLVFLASISSAPTVRGQIATTTAPTLSPTTLAYKYPAPASLTAVQSATATVQLSWTAVSGAAFYKVTGPGSTAAGVSVTGTTVTATAVPGPGMLTWKVAAASTTTMGTVVGAPAVQTIWVKGTTSNLDAPILPTPSFQLKNFNVDEGAKNDYQGRLGFTSLALNQNPQACPYTPMFLYDGLQSPVPAAGYYLSSTGQVEPDSDPAYEKYTILNGGIYFRAPTFPGLRYVRAPVYNTWVFIVNCRNEYSNAVKFRVYPTDFQLQYTDALACRNGQWVFQYGTIAGKQVTATSRGSRLTLHGTGFAGLAPTDQKVVFHIAGLDNSGSSISRDVEAAPAFVTTGSTVLNERSIDVLSPDPATVGLFTVLQAAVSVLKGGQTTVSLPVSYYPTVFTPIPGMSAC